MEHGKRIQKKGKGKNDNEKHNRGNYGRMDA